VGYPIAFIGMISAPPAVGVMLGTWSALRAGWLTPLLRDLHRSFRTDSLRHFLSFAGIMLVAELANVGTVLAVRSLIVHYNGLASAGIFDVAWTLSMAYITLILLSFGTYYLPTLSQTSDPLDRMGLMQRVMRLATLLMVPLVTGVIVLKPLVVEILYSSEFMSSLEIIRWMLVGDYFKVAAWVVATPMLAYADMRVFIWTELLWHAGFLACAALALFGFSSMQGIGVGFLLLYVVYFAYCSHYARSRYQFPLRRAVVGPWLVGLALIVGVSWHTWVDTQVDWFAAVLWMGAAFIFSWLSLNRNERREVLGVTLRGRKIRR
jgi:O-antigen/teichoic acid export membrane protein